MSATRVAHRAVNDVSPRGWCTRRPPRRGRGVWGSETAAREYPGNQTKPGNLPPPAGQIMGATEGRFVLQGV